MLFKCTINVQRARTLQWAFLALHGISLLFFLLLTGSQLIFPLLIIITGSMISFVILSIKPGSPKEIEKIFAYIITLMGYAVLVRDINLGRVDTFFLNLDEFSFIVFSIISVILYIGWTSNRENVINAFDLAVEPSGIAIIFAKDETKRFFHPLSSIMGVKIKDIRTANFSLAKSILLFIKQKDGTVKKISLNLAYVDKDPRRQEGICLQVEKDIGLGERPS